MAGTESELGGSLPEATGLGVRAPSSAVRWAPRGPCLVAEVRWLTQVSVSSLLAPDSAHAQLLGPLCTVAPGHTFSAAALMRPRAHP